MTVVIRFLWRFRDSFPQEKKVFRDPAVVFCYRRSVLLSPWWITMTVVFLVWQGPWGNMHFPAERCGFWGARRREPQEIAGGFQGSRVRLSPDFYPLRHVIFPMRHMENGHFQGIRPYIGCTLIPSFRFQDISLLFWAFSTSFPEIIGVQHRQKFLAFWGGFPWYFRKRKEDQGVACVWTQNFMHFCAFLRFVCAFLCALFLPKWAARKFVHRILQKCANSAFMQYALVIPPFACHRLSVLNRGLQFAAIRIATGSQLFHRKRAEYCSESTFSEKRTHWASLSSAANSVSSARNSVSSCLHTNNRLRGTHWVRFTKLSEPWKTHWVRCLKPYSSKPYSARFRFQIARFESQGHQKPFESLFRLLLWLHFWERPQIERFDSLANCSSLAIRDSNRPIRDKNLP